MLSVVVPCYNEQEVLSLFYGEVTGTLRKIGRDYEIVFVDDGSSDQTLPKMIELAREDAHVVYLSLSRNFGKEAAIYAGLCNARGDYVAVMDADLQDPPELLPEMLRMIEDTGCDCVATRREDRKGEPPLRSWFAKWFYRIINRISDANIVDGARDFRMMRREMVDAVLSMSEYNRFSKGIFGWVGFETHWLSYKNVERAAGKTKWSMWGLFKYAWDGIVNFSQTPLRIASWFGILMTFVAFVMLCFIVLRRILFGDPVAGWASTICVIIFMGGLQMFFLGIMGQYIAKMYMETKRRPHFIIAKTNGKEITKIK